MNFVIAVKLYLTLQHVMLVGSAVTAGRGKETRDMQQLREQHQVV